MANKYKNFGEMISALGEDELTRELKREIEKKALAKFLFFLRCKANLTQEELAKRMKCTQSRISKIEDSYDEDLAIKDIIDYGKALGFILEIGLRPKDVRIVDQLHYHINGIKLCLNQLTKLSDGDESIEKGILDVCKQTLFKMIETVTENMSKLKIIREKVLPVSKQAIQISPPINEVASEELPCPH